MDLIEPPFSGEIVHMHPYEIDVNKTKGAAAESIKILLCFNKQETYIFHRKFFYIHNVIQLMVVTNAFLQIS